MKAGGVGGSRRVLSLVTVVDDDESVLGGASDEQSTIVRAEIDRAVSVTMRLPPLRQALVRWPALRMVRVPQGRRTGDTLRHDYARFCPSPREVTRLT